MAKRHGTKRFLWWSTVAGIVSAAVFLAVAELLALLFARGGQPVLAVGSFVIDIVPQPFKEFAIATFGEYDKIALLVGLGLAVRHCLGDRRHPAARASAARRRRARRRRRAVGRRDRDPRGRHGRLVRSRPSPVRSREPRS